MHKIALFLLLIITFGVGCLVGGAGTISGNLGTSISIIIGCAFISILKEL